MKHLIRKQVINLQLDAGQNAFLIQQQVRDFYFRQIVPALEKIFDELSSENDIVHIEKLEIDLGDLGWENDHFTLDKEAIYQILKQSFGKTISASANSIDSHGIVKYRTAEENACLQWIYYMEKGVLPWDIQSTDTKWLDQVLHQLAIDYVLVEKTRKLIIHDPWFLARLIRDHEDDFLRQFTEVITAKPQPDLIENLRLFAKESSHVSSATPFTKKDFWGQAIRQFAAGIKEPDFQKIMHAEKNIVSESSNRLDQETIQEGIFCQYAGLLLLHPFLRHLFTHLLLLEEGMFKNAASREKAVVLLYFAVTGKTAAKDYELVVPKIICGMQLHEVINEESFMLAESDREEVLNMIQAAIEQWDIIGSTSVEGLRESFLAREGKILIRDSGIEFRIETSGIDILLDRLPWNLSLIRFPWLDKLIHVEWR